MRRRSAPGKRTRPCEHRAAELGAEAGAADRLGLGRGRPRRRRESAAARRRCHGRPLRLRQGQRVEALEQFEAILVAHVRIGDRRDMVASAAACSPAFCSGVVERLGVELVPPQPVDQRFGPVEQRVERRRGRSARIRSSGSCPAGRVTKPSERPGPTWGSARSAARTAAFCPAASPSKQSSGAGESRQSSAELGLGQRGAERRDRLADPGLVERDHVHLALDDDHAASPPGSPARPGRG